MAAQGGRALEHSARRGPHMRASGWAGPPLSALAAVQTCLARSHLHRELDAHIPSGAYSSNCKATHSQLKSAEPVLSAELIDAAFQPCDCRLSPSRPPLPTGRRRTRRCGGREPMVIGRLAAPSALVRSPPLGERAHRQTPSLVRAGVVAGLVAAGAPLCMCVCVCRPVCPWTTSWWEHTVDGHAMSNALDL